MAVARGGVHNDTKYYFGGVKFAEVCSLVRAQPPQHWPHEPSNRGWEKEFTSGGGILSRLEDWESQHCACNKKTIS
jgi:hypothetical protein